MIFVGLALALVLDNVCGGGFVTAYALGVTVGIEIGRKSK